MAAKDANNKHGFWHRELTVGQKFADRLTATVGSWAFMLGLMLFILSWMTFNAYEVLIGAWDPYPFILLNLCLSCFAALQAPIILMSQRRAAERDKEKFERDYLLNKKSELENREIMSELEDVKHLVQKIKR